MEPIPEIETLRQRLQENHIQHVRAEIDLAATFLDFSRIEQKMRDKTAADRSLFHARQALAGACRGISNVSSTEQRAAFQEKISALQQAVDVFAASIAPDPPG